MHFLPPQGLDVISLTPSFVNTTDDLEIQLPGLTSFMTCLEIKEIKVGVNAADAAANLDWITLEILGPYSGMETPSGRNIHIVPNYDATTTSLYRQYHHDNVVILCMNARQQTAQSKTLRIRIKKADGTKLSKDYTYLRFKYVEVEGVSTNAPDNDRFRAN